MRRLLRIALVPLRVLLLLAHLLGGLATCVVIFPPLSQAGRNRIIRFWSRNLLHILGVRLIARGDDPDPEVASTGLAAWSSGRLLLANHVSWLDIFAIQACVPTRFVAKADIAGWPLLGALVTRSGTLYVERGRRHAVAAINRVVAERLKAGESIGVFPEGTTSDGTVLLPFHANLVAPALEVGAEVRPVALRYRRDGAASTVPAYVGDQSLIDSLWQVLATPGLAVEVWWLAALDVPAGATRHELAKAAERAVAAVVGGAATP